LFSFVKTSLRQTIGSIILHR